MPRTSPETVEQTGTQKYHVRTAPIFSANSREADRAMEIEYVVQRLLQVAQLADFRLVEICLKATGCPTC
eukprot:6204310-Pleurochrysis_carterae.AAC.4